MIAIEHDKIFALDFAIESKEKGKVLPKDEDKKQKQGWIHEFNGNRRLWIYRQ